MPTDRQLLIGNLIGTPILSVFGGLLLLIAILKINRRLCRVLRILNETNASVVTLDLQTPPTDKLPRVKSRRVVV